MVTKKLFLFLLAFTILLSQTALAIQTERIVTDRETGFHILNSEGQALPIGDSIIESRDQRTEIVWEIAEPSAISGEISLSGESGNTFMLWHLNDERVSLYHDSAAPLWEYPAGEVPFFFSVDMTPDGSRMVYVADHYVRVFEPDSGEPIWEQNFSGELKTVKIDPNGSQVYICEKDRDGQGVSYISCYQIGQSDPIWERGFEGGAESIILSGNGRTLVFTQYTGGNSAMWVMRSVDGSVIFEGPQMNQNPPAISDNGNLIVNGDYGGYVYLYEYDADDDTYYETWNYRVGGASAWISGMAISGDGGTIAIGTLIFTDTGYDGEIYLFNSYSPEPIWVYENCGDSVTDIDLSQDGSLIAVAGYGPDSNNSPDFWIFRRNSNIPAFTINSPGSMFYLDLSADGALCTVGGKAVHARVMGSGGLLYHIDCDLGGGVLQGAVDLEESDDNSGAKVEILGLIDYFDYSDADGSYMISNIPAGTYIVQSTKVGYNSGMESAEIEEEVTTTIDFSLQQVGSPPRNLFATQGADLSVTLQWDPPDGDAPLGYHIYRKRIAADPYPETPMATVGATELNYEDSSALPLRNYYYAVTSMLENNLQSPYSNEVAGQASSGFVIHEVSVYHGTTPQIDGTISEGEWDDAFVADFSDFLGTYDTMEDPIGSVICYYKTNDAETELYVACTNTNDTVLEDHDEVALYIDDNNDGVYPENGGGDDSEGNYWAAYYASGAVIKYRPLYSPSGSGEVLYLDNPQIAVSDATGYIVYEFVIPIGDESWELTPNNQGQSGMFCFVLDDPDDFNGYWPATNQQIFDPANYGTLTFGASDDEPSPPTNLSVNGNGLDIILSWDMPDMNDFAYFDIYLSLTGDDPSHLGSAVGVQHLYTLPAHGLWEFYVVTVDNSGQISEESETILYDSTVAVEDDIPSALVVTELGQNSPNPFNPATTIAFSLHEKGRVELEVYNIAGQKVKTLLDNKMNPGVHSVSWQGENDNGLAVSSGVYFYRLKTEFGFERSKRMVLLK
ncbi:MAG: hypothetical protein B6244_04010 [Candidatus Cloacimonetes bacterium 4572_55]|nr:MAG: hypothetical protein B6244_04010 [Candidatus Cloacimonetes bacterium 4572_55]